MSSSTSVPNIHPDDAEEVPAGSHIAISPNDLNGLPPALADQVERTTYRYKPDASTRTAPAVRDKGVLVATTDNYAPQTVNVADPSLFRANESQVVAHEGTHEWQQNLPPTQQAAIPPDNTSSVQAMYDFSNAGALRKQGKTLKDLPREEGAAIVENYVKHPEMRPRLQPWVDDMENTPLSSLMPTMPDDPDKQPQTTGSQLWQRLKGLVNPSSINTTSRPPGPPPSYALRGEMPPANTSLGGNALLIRPGNGKQITGQTARAYYGRANGNPAQARALASAHGWKF